MIDFGVENQFLKPTTGWGWAWIFLIAEKYSHTHSASNGGIFIKNWAIFAISKKNDHKTPCLIVCFRLERINVNVIFWILFWCLESIFPSVLLLKHLCSSVILCCKLPRWFEAPTKKIFQKVRTWKFSLLRVLGWCFYGV